VMRSTRSGNVEPFGGFSSVSASDAVQGEQSEQLPRSCVGSSSPAVNGSIRLVAAVV
jgi:hypothetical protein